MCSRRYRWHAKPDQYGCSPCRFRRGTARASGRKAFLRQAAFAYDALWNFVAAISAREGIQAPIVVPNESPVIACAVPLRQRQLKSTKRLKIACGPSATPATLLRRTRCNGPCQWSHSAECSTSIPHHLLTNAMYGDRRSTDVVLVKMVPKS